MQTLTTAVVLVGLLGAASAAAAAHLSGASEVAVSSAKAASADSPYIVEIRQSSWLIIDKHLGSGVLVSPEWVLTSQKAIENGLFSTLYVKVGQPGKAGRLDIDKAQTLKETKDNALALLKLKKPVTLSTSVRPVNLPFQNAYFNSNELSAIPASWGGTGGKALKANDATIVFAADDCGDLLKLPSNTTLLCTTGLKDNVWTCEGDEGAPLVQDMKNGVSKLIGIAVDTKGVSCKKPAAGNAYVNLARHTAWVLNAIYDSNKK